MISPKTILNKLITIKVLGKGKSGDFFGKYNKIVVFIKLKKNESIKFNDFVDIKITGVTEKVAFGELLPFDEGKDGD